MEHLKLFCNIKRQTCDLIHKTESSPAVGFILILSDPDVELGRLITVVIVVELHALDFAVSCWGHYLALQSGGVPLISALSAEVHEERNPCSNEIRWKSSINSEGNQNLIHPSFYANIFKEETLSK